MTVHIPLSDGPFGTSQQVADVHALENALADAIEELGLGEWDGNEIGMGEATLFAYGPDVDALLAAMRPILDAASLPAGAYAVLHRPIEDQAEETRRLVQLTDTIVTRWDSPDAG